MKSFRKTVSVEVQDENLSLVTGITYATVSSWYDATKRDMKMDLIIPKVRDASRPRPLVVWICGGGFMRMDRSVWLPELIRLARAGYSVASVEYRTSNEGPFPMALCDVKAAIRYLKAHAADFAIDPDRIFVMGESAGGTLASLVGVTAGHKDFEVGDHLNQDSYVAGVVDFYGLVDFSGYVSDSEDGRMLNLTTDTEDAPVPCWAMPAFIGTPISGKKIRQASAVTYVDHNTVPFMILHGANDPLVSISQSESLYDKLTEAGVYTEYYVLEGAVHGDQMFYQDEVFAYIIDFMKKVETFDRQH